MSSVDARHADRKATWKPDSNTAGGTALVTRALRSAALIEVSTNPFFVFSFASSSSFSCFF